MILLDNLLRIRENISKCGREVTLVAACKTQTIDTVRELMSIAPECVLGENRVQELTAKFDNSYRWHFIGRLQTNKVKDVVGRCELIHSLDRSELAHEIDKCAGKKGIIQHCLVEVNMGDEASKGGVAASETISFIEELNRFKNVKVEGLMSVMPKDCDNLEELYEKLYKLFESAKANFEGIRYLSAGMSSDYETALAHGANIIRIGRLIFGERVYPALNLAK